MAKYPRFKNFTPAIKNRMRTSYILYQLPITYNMAGFNSVPHTRLVELLKAWCEVEDDDILTEVRELSKMVFARELVGGDTSTAHAFRLKITVLKDRPYMEPFRLAIQDGLILSTDLIYKYRPMRHYAIRIQRAWRKAIADPNTPVCRNRLMRECQELSVM